MQNTKKRITNCDPWPLQGAEHLDCGTNLCSARHAFDLGQNMLHALHALPTPEQTGMVDPCLYRDVHVGPAHAHRRCCGVVPFASTFDTSLGLSSCGYGRSIHLLLVQPLAWLRCTPACNLWPFLASGILPSQCCRTTVSRMHNNAYQLCAAHRALSRAHDNCAPPRPESWETSCHNSCMDNVHLCIYALSSWPTMPCRNKRCWQRLCQ